MLFLFVFWCSTVFGQKQLFHLYKDSTGLAKDANAMAVSFFDRVRQADKTLGIAPVFVIGATAIPDTYLPQKNTINIALWKSLDAAQKNAFDHFYGKEAAATKAFELFANGFNIIRDLGRSVQFAREKGSTKKFESDYFANTLAVLFLRASGESRQLDECYKYVRKMLVKIPDPVPPGENTEDYYNKNYAAIVRNPCGDTYYQFSQFVKIYEDKSLPGFDAFIKNYSVR